MSTLTRNNGSSGPIHTLPPTSALITDLSSELYFTFQRRYWLKSSGLDPFWTLLFRIPMIILFTIFKRNVKIGFVSIQTPPATTKLGTLIAPVRLLTFFCDFLLQHMEFTLLLTEYCLYSYSIFTIAVAIKEISTCFNFSCIRISLNFLYVLWHTTNFLALAKSWLTMVETSALQIEHLYSMFSSFQITMPTQSPYYLFRLSEWP